MQTPTQRETPELSEKGFYAAVTKKRAEDSDRFQQTAALAIETARPCEGHTQIPGEQTEPVTAAPPPDCRRGTEVALRSKDSPGTHGAGATARSARLRRGLGTGQGERGNRKPSDCEGQGRGDPRDEGPGRVWRQDSESVTQQINCLVFFY